MVSTSSSSSPVNHLLHPLHHRTLLIPKFPSLLKHTQFPSPLQFPSSRIQPTSAIAAKESIWLILIDSRVFRPAIYRSGFKCLKCNKSYSSKNIYLDLTVIAGAKDYVEIQPSRTELFRSPLVSFLYERGWRQNFNFSGFPGPDEEVSSIDAVHAGAALHCWPSPSNAIAEINRILRSGGVFVGTTFLRSTSSTPAILRPFDRRIGGSYNYLTEEEIEDLCKSCGLTNYTTKVQQAFIMFSAQKP
ncbi:hypothetical protein Ccrd_003562 [Cynara cardunculus var. scolymus]|uniref:Uncharacterized protein n=1 Tax=Cynara cardunculus var. scolymus TaxID=59895 RepID=A0A103XPI7_CYNCS|nr:hypothetical protein Ccrd_003562 [Cynara cardunculus var. scolymus]